MPKEITYKIHYKNGEFDLEEFKRIVTIMYENWEKEQIAMSCNNYDSPYNISLTK